MAKLIGVINFFTGHITGNGTTTVVNKTAYIASLEITCFGVGGTFGTLTVQSKEATPKILFQCAAAKDANVTKGFGAGPLIMPGGIDIILTGATTPPPIDIWITYSQ